MTHKNAQHLLREVNELFRELEVYAGQRESFFSCIRRLDRDYQAGKYGYLEYEEKQKAALKGRTKQEWADYYEAYIYSLLKKADFILAQVYTIVQDDNSFNRLQLKGTGRAVGEATASVEPMPKLAAAAAAAAEKAVEKEHYAGVFNIDNELERLKALLASASASASASQQPSQGQLEKLEEALGGSEALQAMRERVRAVRASVPEFERLAKDVEEAELKAAKPAPTAAVAKHIFAGIAKAAKSVAHTFATAESAVKLAVAKAIAKKEPAFAKLPSPALLFRRPEAKPKQAGAAGKALPQREGIFSALKQLVLPGSAKSEGIFVEEIVAMEKQAKVSERLPAAEQKGTAGLAFGWFSVKGMINELTEKFRPKQEPVVGERTAVPAHLKKLKEMRKKLYDEEKLSTFDATLLAQEARRVKKILEVEKPEVYQGSSVGLIANLTVRKVSLFLVDSFPEFFGFLYNALRSANVKVLSNTYANIMILSTFFVTAVAFLILMPLFFMLGYPLYQIALRATIFSIVAGFACATIFYAYPFMKIKDRRRNVMTNMPFAINHMAAVATSGVPPASMFELIAASKEYGEIGVEVKKIVDFISIFGYDLLTAIRTVAATTPSQPFKEFLEGIVSTIETGGDLDTYLRQEAEQAALTYNLERQRYNETVSTYSDIYTGLLIAAPLFFVAAMALVNMLGGSLGGIGVDVVMAVGAYVVIPLLNVGFLAFLQITQPEV